MLVRLLESEAAAPEREHVPAPLGRVRTRNSTGRTSAVPTTADRAYIHSIRTRSAFRRRIQPWIGPQRHRPRAVHEFEMRRDIH
jgi:hypothetical protein